MNIDQCAVPDILRIINDEDRKVAGAVGNQMDYIGKAVDLVVKSFQSGGRLIYCGAGTSGRLGVVDASECPPTFGVGFELVQGLIAGGPGAMFRAVEGAEDFPDNGVRDIASINTTAVDTVCGIAASLRTPYVRGALCEAKQRGAATLLVTTNPRVTLARSEYRELAEATDVAICVEVGPEVIMGSTRMKSGTAQKMVLNMITTTAMIRMGKVYENMMVDLQLTNKKLIERARRVLMNATDLSYEDAAALLDRAGGHVKSAIVMALAGVNREEALQRLANAGGYVRAAVEGAIVSTDNRK